jgi:hypothetical protein
LPSQESLEKSDKENSGTAAENLKWYQQIRKRLIIEYGMLYVDRNGKINDFVLIALLLALEVGGEYPNEYYQAVLSAISQQYHTTRFQYPSSSAVCYGSCTTEEQLIWLQGMEAVRSETRNDTLFQIDDSGAVFWEGFIEDARAATAAPLSSRADGRRYWHWGNRDRGIGDFRLPTPPGVSYFEVYGWDDGWIK